MDPKTLKALGPRDGGPLRWVEYNPDDGKFRWRGTIGARAKKGAVLGTVKASGYVRLRIKGVQYYAHRLAFEAMGQEVPEEVDHINRDRSDNRWGNLRAADRSLNQCNKALSQSNTSGYVGVNWHSKEGRWRAVHKGRHLGYFDTPELAHAAYMEANDGRIYA